MNIIKYGLVYFNSPSFTEIYYSDCCYLCPDYQNKTHLLCRIDVFANKNNMNRIEE